MIKINNMQKTFGHKIVLEKVNIEFQRGRKYGLIGRNATGKSTLFKLLSKMSTPTSGTIENTFSNIDYIDDKYTVMGNDINKFLEFYHVLDEKFNLKNATKRLKEMNISLNDKINDLSKGQKAVIRLIAAQESSSDLILVDELLDGLDLSRRRQVMESINSDLNKSRTYILVDHNLDDLVEVTHELFYIKNKNIYYIEDVEKKLEESNNLSTWFERDNEMEVL
jgi:ABC-type multidrug transport system ATPase subunit